MISPRDIAKITKQFTANLQAIERVKVKLEIIENENRQMLKLLSEQKQEPETLLNIKMQSILARRHARIKTK